MITAPHDVTDLFLAPVAIGLDARLDELGALSPEDLAQRVARESDMADWTREMREVALLRALTHLIDLRGWQVGFVERGVEMSNGTHRIVLGMPAALLDYLSGVAPV